MLAILTVIGIALMLITSTETRIAANEWSINRGFYASDAGVRWGTARDAHGPRDVPARAPSSAPRRRRSSRATSSSRCRATASGPTLGFIGNDDIEVRVSTPGRLYRRICFGCQGNAPGEKAQYMWGFEVRSTGSQDDRFLQYSKALVADVEAGPLPGRLPF